MCIADAVRIVGRLLAKLAVAACACAMPFAAVSHPVAQGAVDVEVQRDGLTLRAQISLEEVAVGNLYAGHGELPAAERLRRYGDYLLQHLDVRVDAHRLQGRVVSLPDRLVDPVTYTFDYAYPTSSLRELRFAQDALREYLYAPGNPWEARYLFRVAASGQRDAPARLLTSHAPLVFRVSDDATIQPAERSAASLNRDLLVDGIRHILGGYDHLLFIAALLLAVTGLWELVKVVTAFTLAHSATLALATFGVLRLPPAIVEPVIAASIVAVAVQNLVWPRQSRGGPRLATTFVFGLFHGLGYAGGLIDAMQALSIDQTVQALVAFSVGVEIGHQIVVIPLYAAIHAWRRHAHDAARADPLLRFGSALVGCAGLGYLLSALHAAGPAWFGAVGP